LPDQQRTRDKASKDETRNDDPLPRDHLWSV
jgi:hypothetical protein